MYAQVLQRHKGPLLAVTFRDKGKCPILLSTLATSGWTQSISKRSKKATPRPNVAALYNKTMGGVDLSDAMLYQ